MMENTEIRVKSDRSNEAFNHYHYYPSIFGSDYYYCYYYFLLINISAAIYN